MIKVLYLLNTVRHNTDEIENIEKGKWHDNNFFGMFRLRKRGFKTNFFELEQFLPAGLTKFLRKYINIWWIHLPMFPLFFKYDIVFSSTAYASMLLKAMLHLKRPKWVILDFNIDGTIGEKKTFRQKMLNFAVSRADGIITISKAEEITLKEKFPHLARKIEFIHEGVDTEFFKPDPTISEENFILSVGFNPDRDFKTVIEATKDLGVPLVLATKPSRVAHLQPLPPHVSVRSFSHDEMQREYQKAKIVVIGLNLKADNNDSMGTFAVAEALAMGKAVVATRSKSLESYIEDGKSGRLVPMHDFLAMKTAIEDLLQNDTKRREFGRAAREFAAKNVNTDVFADKLAQYFRALMAKDVS